MINKDKLTKRVFQVFTAGLVIAAFVPLIKARSLGDEPAAATIYYIEPSDSYDDIDILEEVTGPPATVVKYSQKSNYDVLIPKNIILTQSKSASYSVGVSGDISSDESIEILPRNEIQNKTGINFNMTEKTNGVNKKEDAIASLTQQKTNWKFDDMGDRSMGYIESQDLSAGNWEGKIKFQIIHNIPEREWDEEYNDNEDVKTKSAGLYNPQTGINMSWNELINNGVIVIDEATQTLTEFNPELIYGNSDPINYAKKVANYDEAHEEMIDNIEQDIFNNNPYLGTYVDYILTPNSSLEEKSATFKFIADEIQGFDLVIPGDVKHIAGLNNTYYLRSITLKEGVETIENNGISGNYGLTKINLPKSLISIGKNGLSNNIALKKIEIPSNVDYISESAFKNNYVTKIKNNSLVRSGNYWGAIVNPNSLKYSRYNDFILNGSKLEGYLGSDTTVNIPSTITEISDYAFYYNNTIETVNIYEGLMSIDDYAFSRCDNLTNITLPSTINHIGYDAFLGTGWYNNLRENSTDFIIIGSVLYLGNNCTGEVIIPDGITEICAAAFLGNENITSVVIPNSVTTIGERAFMSCTNLENVTLSNNVSEIGLYAFYGTKWLETNGGAENGLIIVDNIVVDGSACTGDVVIPEGVTKIDKRAFYDNNKITSVICPESLTEIDDSAFYWCDNLASVIMSDNVTRIGKSAFTQCEKLTSIDLSDSLTCIEKRTFIGCSGLKDVKFPKNLVKIKSGAFAGCINISDLTFPSTLKYINEQAFTINYDLATNLTSVYNITRIVLPSGLLHIGDDAFSGHSTDSFANRSKLNAVENNYWGLKILTAEEIRNGLQIEDNAVVKFVTESGYGYGAPLTTSIVIPDGVTTIKANAFSGRQFLSEVIIPDSVTEIGDYAFYSCSNINEIVIPDGVTKIGRDAFRACQNLKEITIPAGVTVINQNTFMDCVNLENIVIPAGVTTIGTNAFKNTKWLAKQGSPFILNNTLIDASGCSGDVIIPNGVTIIPSSAFEKNQNITSVTIPEGVTKLNSYTFSGCTNLETVNLPSGLEVIDMCVFDGCSNLSTITIPDSVTKIDYAAFRGCNSLTEITIPGNTQTVGQYVFKDCTNLQTVEIKNGVEILDDYAFENCINLTTVTLPETLLEIGYRTFKDCKLLTTIELHQNLTKIDQEAFYNCKGLTGITIPESVTYVGTAAFRECSNLTRINCEVRSLPNSWSTSWKNNCSASVIWGYTGE